MPRRTLLRLTLGLLLCLTPAAACAADAKEERGFLDRVHKDADGKEAKYVLFVPHDYKGDTPSPLILFLHGSGETLGGTKQPVEVGIGPAVKQREKTFPFLVVFPQSQKRTWKADSEDGERAMAILAEVQKEYKVDDKRVYLTGLSMGGAGAWSFAAKYPERWAALVPLCGGGEDPDAYERIKDIPCWAFYGADDRPPGLKRCDETMTALRALGAKPGYTVYPATPHNCWDKAYGTEELYDWLLKQQRK
jgi:predicted peptidase